MNNDSLILEASTGLPENKPSDSIEISSRLKNLYFSTIECCELMNTQERLFVVLNYNPNNLDVDKWLADLDNIYNKIKVIIDDIVTLERLIKNATFKLPKNFNPDNLKKYYHDKLYANRILLRGAFSNLSDGIDYSTLPVNLESIDKERLIESLNRILKTGRLLLFTQFSPPN